MSVPPGGLTSKIHVLVDAKRRSVAPRLTGGQIHDSRKADALLEAISHGATLLAGKGYDSNAILEAAAVRNSGPTLRRWGYGQSRSHRCFHPEKELPANLCFTQVQQWSCTRHSPASTGSVK